TIFKDEQSGIICVDKEVEEDKNRCQEEIISDCSESSNPVLVLEILRATHTHTPALFSHLLRMKTKQKRENSGLEMELRKQDLSLRLFPSPPPNSSSPLFSRTAAGSGLYSYSSRLSDGCLEIFENTNQNTSPEAPTPWLALMGMKHSSRCLLLRRKMAENAADSTEVSKDASRSRRRAPPDPGTDPSAGAAPSAEQLSRPLRPAPACRAAMVSCICLPSPPTSPRIPLVPVGREVCPAPSPPGASREVGRPCGAEAPRGVGAAGGGNSEVGHAEGTDRLLRQHLG
ncbi:hypothetical protein Nmel_006498, partial [Mimus melanotis]